MSISTETETNDSLNANNNNNNNKSWKTAFSPNECLKQPQKTSPNLLVETNYDSNASHSSSTSSSSPVSTNSDLSSCSINVQMTHAISNENVSSNGLKLKIDESSSNTSTNQDEVNSLDDKHTTNEDGAFKEKDLTNTNSNNSSNHAQMKLVPMAGKNDADDENKTLTSAKLTQNPNKKVIFCLLVRKDVKAISN